MAKSAKMAWGIDVGNCTLKAIKLGVTEDGVEVLDFEVIEHEKILSQPEITLEERMGLLTRALDKFLDEHDTAGCNVVVSVSGQNSFARFVKLPPVETKRIPALVPLEAQQQIPFNMNDVEWDWQTFQTPDNPDIELGIFAIKRDLVHRALAPFSRVGCGIDMVQMAPMALYNFLRYDQQQLQNNPQEAVIVLDIGAENTDLIIMDGLKVWQRSIPVGGNQFTAAVQKAFKLSFTKAEAIKRTASTSKYARQIFQAMRSVFADLAAEIQRSLGFYSSGNRDVRFREVIALGNAMKLPGLIKFLQQSLSLPVKRLDGFDSLELTSDISMTKFTANLPSMAVAYGLALQGVGEGTINSNLLPREIIRQTAWRKKRPFFIGAAAVFMLAGLLSFINANALRSNINSAKGSISEIKRYETVVNRNRSQYDEMEQKIQQDKTEFQKIADLYSDRVVVPSLYKTVFTKLPNEKYNSDQSKLYDLFKQGDKQGIINQFPDRHQRKQVFISSIQIVYADDLNKSFDELTTFKTQSRTTTSPAGGYGEGFDPMMEGYGEMMPDMMPGGPMGPGGGGYGGGYGGYQAAPSSKKPGPAEQTETTPGFVVIIEGSTPHHGFNPEKPDGLGFLMPPEVGLDRSKWGFFQRLLYLGQSDKELYQQLKNRNVNSDAAAGGGQNAPAVGPVNVPRTDEQKQGSEQAAKLPFKIFNEPENIRDYFDYTENGWVSTIQKTENQPSGVGISKPVDPAATRLAGTGGRGGGFGTVGPTRTRKDINQIDPLIDPLTFEPVSEIYKVNANGEIVYGPDQQPVIEKNDYWFRLRFKVKLKSADKPDGAVAQGGPAGSGASGLPQ